MNDELPVLRPAPDLLPPGVTTPVTSRRTLVVAPHYDDEVLGCGGLVAALAAGGAEIRVVFLTDSAGGGEVDDPSAYAAERRREAIEAARVLGVSTLDHLERPDGRLGDDVEGLAAALRTVFEAHAPDLVLAPSPLEVTGDHRAAFAALHRLLTRLRPGDSLQATLASTQVLLYEVNHPGYPNLLVDVSEQVATIEAAMACYASQQEQHDYLGAALGLRRYRALSLPRGIEAAEGYRALDLEAFASHGLAALGRAVGGRSDLIVVDEAPAISVVVRTFERPRLLAEALASLAASTWRRLEIVLVNDGGRPPEVGDELPFPVRRVDLTENLGRAEAANAGVRAAGGSHVAFLDDDDLVEPHHFAVLARLATAAGVEVAYTDAAVGVYELAAGGGWRLVDRRVPYSRDFDPDVLLLDNYIPLNTLIVPRSRLLEAGPFDPQLPFFEDWDLLIRLAALVPFRHLGEVTCEYRHFRGGAHVLGERPRERADFLAMKERVIARHRDRLGPDALARAVDRLRQEGVEAAESDRSARRELRQSRQELDRARRDLELGRQALRRRDETYFALERSFHEQRGRLTALEGDHAALVARRAELDREVERLYGEETALRVAVGEQTTSIGELYAEIERLNRRIAEMEATRAWRLHTWIERRR